MGKSFARLMGQSMPSHRIASAEWEKPSPSSHRPQGPRPSPVDSLTTRPTQNQQPGPIPATDPQGLQSYNYPITSANRAVPVPGEPDRVASALFRSVPGPVDAARYHWLPGAGPSRQRPEGHATLANHALSTDPTCGHCFWAALLIAPESPALIKESGLI
ncbi:hypothetical protein FDECE_16908 [Fusarium decemcellulare]|nr:hypothetical protein FDECE_16908 [Fusarium decemcellulare]